MPWSTQPISSAHREFPVVPLYYTDTKRKRSKADQGWYEWASLPPVTQCKPQEYSSNYLSQPFQTCIHVTQPRNFAPAKKRTMRYLLAQSPTPRPQDIYLLSMTWGQQDSRREEKPARSSPRLYKSLCHVMPTPPLESEYQILNIFPSATQMFHFPRCIRIYIYILFYITFTFQPTL